MFVCAREKKRERERERQTQTDRRTYKQTETEEGTRKDFWQKRKKRKIFPLLPLS